MLQNYPNDFEINVNNALGKYTTKMYKVWQILENYVSCTLLKCENKKSKLYFEMLCVMGLSNPFSQCFKSIEISQKRRKIAK